MKSLSISSLIVALFVNAFLFQGSMAFHTASAAVQNRHSTRSAVFERHSVTDSSATISSNSRRHVMAFLPAAIASSFAVLTLLPEVSQAVVVETPAKEKVFIAGQPLGLEGAKERFGLARKTLDDLLTNYDEIRKGGGDNVRRYLGTVGTSSALYGISKVMKELQEEASDIVEYTENMSEFDYSLRSADTSVYSANFVEFSSAKTKPEKFFEDARTEIERMQVYMDNMAAELKLK